MNKYSRVLLFLLVIFSFTSCKNESVVEKDKPSNYSAEEVEYPVYTVSEYDKMDNYVLTKTIAGIKYKYTYFFKEEMCVNAKEELTFNSKDKAQAFYDENKDAEDYIDINIKSNVVTYYYNPEYFEYLMYPKDVLIELLNSVENDE